MIDRLHHFLPGWALAYASRLRAAWPDLLIWLLAPLRLLPGNSTRWGPPRGMVAMSDLTAKPWSKYTIYKDERWQLPLPVNYHERLASAFADHTKEFQWLCGVGELQVGRVLAPDGAVVTPDDHVVWDYSRIIGRPGKRHPALGRVRLPKVEHFDGRLAVLQVHQADNYYHWLLEVLPRLGLLRSIDAKADAYYVSARTKFQKESLALAGITPEQVLAPNEHRHVEAECLVLPSRPGVGCPSPQALTFARQLFAPMPSQSPRRRIYITRRLAARRKVLNEDALLPILERFGVVVAETEKLSFKEQIQLFSEAEWVIAPHGAGLANLVFCKPGTQVLELFAADYVNRCYWGLAGAGGLTYSYLIAENGEVEKFTQGAHGRSDMTISPQALHSIIKSW